MFDKLRLQPADSLLSMIKEFQSDGRGSKVDLGIGVYRDASGNTPVMKAVKQAERILLESQDSKRYLGPEGDPDFVDLLKPIIFGEGNGFNDRLIGIQTPGGSGALRLGAELINAASTNAKVWIGTPSWSNHGPIFSSARVALKDYRFVDLAHQAVNFEGARQALTEAESGDIVLLHGCCHNPTGLDFSIEQWNEIARILSARGLVPFIDLAYQGLGEGLEKDAAATRLILNAVDEAMIAYSCDKNFGLYRERVGALYTLARTPSDVSKIASNMAALARVNWSMPPDHGAAVVRLVLERADLVSIWQAELIEMCNRVNANRAALAGGHLSLDFIRHQRGLFSNLNITKAKALALRANHGIYVAESGRVNLAGMGAGDVQMIVAGLMAEGCV
ncbi:amino acid aminotransferase [Bradyrhizobium sp. USDA 3315]